MNNKYFDEGIFPWCWEIYTEGVNNSRLLSQLIRGQKVADIFVILGSIDVVMGAVDR